MSKETETNNERQAFVDAAIAGTMQLVPGTAPASGASTRRPRPVAAAPADSPNSVLSQPASKVAGEGASHDARGGRAPLQLHRSG